MRRLALLALAALPCASSGVAQSTAPLDTIFAVRHAEPPGPALAMAVLHRGEVVYRNVAGWADLERRVPATLETRFDVASLAKQFTAFAVSRLIEEGRLGLTDPVDRHLPELDLSGARITIEQLIHHTSGLEDSDGLMALAGWRPGDAVHHHQLVELLLRQQHLRFAPGEGHFYSNGGYTLLAEVVARVTGEEFPAHLRRTVFAPLGMRSTLVPGDDGTMVPNRATPYARLGGIGALQRSRVDTYLGAGGVYATVGDLLRWAQHLMHPAHDSLATLRLRGHGRLTSGEEIAYAWGLGVGQYRGRATLAHSGSGPATEAHLLVIPELDFAVVAVAAGPTGVNPTALAHRAADIFLAGQLDPVAAPAPGSRRMLMLTAEEMHARPPESEGVEIPHATLRHLAGIYQLGDHPPMVVRAGAGQLEFTWGGRGDPIPLFPLPGGRFVMMPLWDVYRFTTDSAGRGVGIVRERTPRSLRQSGPEQVEGRRLPDPPPLDAARAAPYLGWYFSEEVGTFYEVVLGAGGLELRHARLGRFPLVELGQDRFAVQSPPLAQVRFARGGDGVVGLELEAVSWSVTAGFRRVTLPP